jgi:hypothetical protein
VSVGLATFRRWLEHPLTRGRPLDDPQTTALRRRIIREKAFLRRLYAEWFALVREALPPGAGEVVELGSGGASIREVIPGVITSEVFRAPAVQVVADARALPFAPGTLRALVLVDVLHHVPDVARFFRDAAACVRAGGAIVAIEPWVTPWSRLVYRRLHHEPFDPNSEGWTLPPGGPLSTANGALPWIVLQRDRARFERELPEWSVRTIRPLMPVSYLLSGGVSMRSLAPGWLYPAVRAAEEALAGWGGHAAMFALLVVERTAVPAARPARLRAPPPPEEAAEGR